ncbi:hypothetical protein, partial [Klebsiella pneumoniae]|uniref:hypothetical protein n=1 Tax=Klebsiella pneumoniae TaxID=573 RepID=UPI003A85402F
MKKLLGANKDRMGTDQKAVLLVSKVNERLKHIPPFTTEHHGKVLQVDFELPRPQSRVELKPEPFGVYHSPLLAFKSYRFSPYFRTKEKLSLR